MYRAGGHTAASSKAKAKAGKSLLRVGGSRPLSADWTETERGRGRWAGRGVWPLPGAQWFSMPREDGAAGG